MIIDIQYLLDFGLPISEELSDNNLNRAIYTAEHYILAPRIGDDLYIAILNAIVNEQDTYDTVLDGGVLEKTNEKGELVNTYVNGLRTALGHIAYSILLTNYLNVTIFGSNLKKDDYSDQAGLDRIRTIGMQHMEIGLWYIRQITDWYGIKTEDKMLPDINEELI